MQAEYKDNQSYCKCMSETITQWVGQSIGIWQESVGLSEMKGGMTMSSKTCLKMTTSNFCGTSMFEQTMKLGPEDRIL